MLSITEVHEGVFHLRFDTRIEVAAHFLRFQEFYESDNPGVKGQPFQLIDYIKWYASERENCFSYFTDWSGFNIPAQIVLDCYEGIEDTNDHDDFMRLIALKALARHPKAYLIGSSEEATDAVDHELAHGLFYVDQEYRNTMCTLLREEVPRDVYEVLERTVLDMGYDWSVSDDEIQAYLATGLPESMGDYANTVAPLRTPFVEVFQMFTKSGRP